jgi:archaellum component FlaG (FlaF/FlaG flagellin family)
MRRTTLALLITTLFAAASAFAGTWYVATPANGGNNSNAGTLAAPFATITKGVSMLSAPGDILYVRAGTYNEYVTIWNKTGSDSSPIRIMPYNNEDVVIDGTGTTASNAVVAIGESSHIRFDDFEVKNGPDTGIRVYNAQYIRVRYNYVHDNQSFGIAVSSASASTRGTTHHIIVDGNTVKRNVRSNASRSSSAGWTQGIGSYRADDVEFINNYVSENFGEGIDCVLTDGCKIAYNTVYDNFGTNIYLDNATDALVDRNFCMAGRVSNAGDYTRSGYGASGIAMANESYTVNGTAEQNPLNNITITNNITVNGKFGFVYGNYEYGGGLHNTLIANNTFYGGEDLVFYIQNGSTDIHDTTTIRNNIFYAKTGRNYAYATSANITYGYNNWYNGTANTHKSGPGDVLANPLLVNAGTDTKTDYKLTSTSPCINAGTAITAVTTDYWGTARGTVYDIGAHEY